MPLKPKYIFHLKGLSAEYDFKKIVKVAKKEFACNGTVVEHPEYGEVIGHALRKEIFETAAPIKIDYYCTTHRDLCE